MSLLDPRAARFGQGVVGAGALAAFVLDAPLAVPVLAALLAAGALLGPHANPLTLLWRHGVAPLLRLGAPAKRKEAAPVRFAQAVGLAFLASASVLLLAPALPDAVGWALVLAVAALALLAALTDVCVGCGIYVRLRAWRARRSAA